MVLPFLPSLLQPLVTSSFEEEPPPELIKALRRVESRLEETGKYLCGKVRTLYTVWVDVGV